MTSIPRTCKTMCFVCFRVIKTGKSYTHRQRHTHTCVYVCLLWINRKFNRSKYVETNMYFLQSKCTSSNLICTSSSRISTIAESFICIPTVVRHKGPFVSIENELGVDVKIVFSFIVMIWMIARHVYLSRMCEVTYYYLLLRW